MNPFKKFRHIIIGKALSNTDDVFEKAKIEVLFNFTAVFLLLNIPYMFQTLSIGNWFHILLSITSTAALFTVLIIFYKTNNIRWAVNFYVLNHGIQICSHFLINNGVIELTGNLFLVLFVLFSYLMLDRKWGLAFTIISVLLIILGIYNNNTHFSLFEFPPEYKEQTSAELQYMMIVPFLLNIYLVSEFVKARQKAEVQIDHQKMLLESNNRELESKNEDIVSSINYAKRIQQAILPNDENIQRGIPLSFILYKPRDIVSGDFYWFSEIDPDSYIIVAADCTGHGVPGAFMTVIGSNLLTQIINENKVTEPSLIMTQLDQHITATLKQEKQHLQIIQDGMDLSLLKVNKQTKEFVYTSAKRPAILIRNNEMQEFKGSKNTLGGLRSGEKTFDEIKIKYQEGDIIYLFTDGYIDQFGGAGNKKFMIRRLRELLLSVHHLPMHEQKLKLNASISEWIGSNEQTDDILIMGIKF